jgi:dienelactone hydrolase
MKAFPICCGLLTSALAFAITTAWGDDSEKTRPPCPYRTAHDAPLNSKIESVDSADDHTKFRVEFDGIKGDRVPAFLYVPKEGSGKLPAVLLQYGSGGDKKTDYIVALAHQFVTHGFVVLTIDSPGRGERKSPQATKRSPTDWLQGGEGRELFLQYCGDYSRATDYLASREDVSADRLAYVGISWGAITGVTYVAHDTRIKAMGSMVGGGDFLANVAVPKGDDAAKNETPKNVEKLPSIDPVHHVAQIAPRPLLLLNATKDQLVPRPFGEALHNAAGSGAKKVWLETDHFFSGLDRHEVGESVIQFIEQNVPTKP